VTVPGGDLRVGIIGTGIMGADHARIIDGWVSGATVSALADVDVDRAALVAKGLSRARVVADGVDLIAASDVDAVVVASADPTHEAFVLRCLEMGKPVLCEKPLAPTAEAAARIVAADTSGLVSVGFMRRFDPGFVELKAAIAEGAIGLPLVMHCVHRNVVATPGTTGASVITNSAIHEIDEVRWLFDEEIVAVAARTPHRAARPAGAVDPLLLSLESASGLVTEVEVTVAAGYGYEVRGEVVGETGAIFLDAPPLTARRTGNQRREAIPEDWRPRFAEAYRLELQDWVTAVRAGTRSAAATAWDGYLANVVAAAAVAALASGTRVEVELPAR
jgi:myo-inositol 2-dehydrogenase / D-chiro-inositol 1-dehydrogenase